MSHWRQFLFSFLLVLSKLKLHILCNSVIVLQPSTFDVLHCRECDLLMMKIVKIK